MVQVSVPQYFIYLLTNEWRNVLYTGVTNSLERRIWEHKNRAVEGFTKKYNCELLVYFEIYYDINQAIAREKQIKGWTRAKKNALVETMNPKWQDLASDWYQENAGGPSPRSAAAPPDHPAAPPAQDDSELAAACKNREKKS